jgi:hypothetical protein
MKNVILSIFIMMLFASIHGEQYNCEKDYTDEEDKELKKPTNFVVYTLIIGGKHKFRL